MKIMKKAFEGTKKVLANRYVQAAGCGFLGIAGAEVAKKIFRKDEPLERQPEVQETRIVSFNPMDLIQEGAMTFKYTFRTPCVGGYNRFELGYSRILTEEEVLDVVSQKYFADALSIALGYDDVKVETLKVW